jgi:methyl-accepting chemotaxis protein
MSIKLKLSLVLGVLVTIIVSLLLGGYFTVAGMNQQLGSVVADRVYPLQQLKVVADAYAVAIVDNVHKVRSGAVSWEDGLAVYGKASADIEKNWSAYQSTRLTADEVVLVAQAKAAMTAAQPGLAEMVSILQSSDQAGIDHFATQELYPIIDPISEAISKLVDLQVNVALLNYELSQQTFHTTIAVALVLAVLVVIAVACAAFVILRTVSGRLSGMENALLLVADGDVTTQIPSAGDKDEIGRIAQAAETFRQNAIRVAAMTEAEAAQLEANTAARRKMMEELQLAFGSVVEASIAGDFSKRVPAQFPDRELNALAGSVNTLVATVEQGLAETGSVLSALSEADLTKRVEGHYQGAFDRLKNDVNTLAGKLAEIVTQLRTTSGSVKAATTEILSGANDLAERTTRQAAAIEQTSAAMEQLSSTVHDNAQRADEADSKSRAFAQSAEATGAVMLKANSAMDSISSSSRKISDIIGIIDDIAFQTNLLALNASVEAARAGDAGKGFAVVAVEVRRLAQSAAQASNEVKALIDQSSAEVSTGSRLVAEAAERLQAMLRGVHDNVALIDGIASASREQSSAIVEVSAAIRQMDEMTQHNAALVEQTNAAIEQTEAQAQQLDAIVDVFILEKHAKASLGSTPEGHIPSPARLAG